MGDRKSLKKDPANLHFTRVAEDEREGRTHHARDAAALASTASSEVAASQDEERVNWLFGFEKS